MIYGEYSIFVEEILDEISNMPLFKRNKLSIDEVLEIHDFEKAKELAFEFDEFEMNGEKEWTWCDIKEVEMSKIYGIMQELEDYKNLINKMYELNEIVWKKIKIESVYRYVKDEVYSDLIYCLRTRVTQGDSHVLFEKLFEVYKAGGWPCGWEGNYPDGKLIAFFPE